MTRHRLLAPVLAAAHRAVEEAVNVDEHQDVGLLGNPLEQLAEDPAVPTLGVGGERNSDGRKQGHHQPTAMGVHGVVLSVGEEGVESYERSVSGLARAAGSKIA